MSAQPAYRMQVIPSEFGARLPLLFPFYRGYWRDGDVSSVPTLPHMAAALYKSCKGSLLRLGGRQQAYHRLQQAGQARLEPTHEASDRRHQRGAEPQAQPWMADDGSTSARRQSRGKVLAQMRNLRKVEAQHASLRPAHASGWLVLGCSSS